MIVDNPLYAYWTILDDAPEFNVYRIVRSYGSILH